MIVFVDEILKDSSNHWDLMTHDEIGLKHRFALWKEPFTNPMFETLYGKQPKIPTTYTERKSVQLVWATYGYVITTHKSQGSEWDSVLVQDEWMPPTVWDMKRWRYTAITRAAKKLVYCI